MSVQETPVSWLWGFVNERPLTEGWAHLILLSHALLWSLVVPPPDSWRKKHGVQPIVEQNQTSDKYGITLYAKSFENM